MRASYKKKLKKSHHKSHIFYMFLQIFQNLEIPGISWNFLISRKLPGKNQDFPEFGKFPSKWKH